MPIYMTAQGNCRPGSESNVAKAIGDFVGSVAKNDPGTRVYTALQHDESPTGFMTYFVFADEAARNPHRSTEWVNHLADITYPENDGDVVFTEFRLVTSTDAERSTMEGDRTWRSTS